jgi:ribonuclease J
MSSKTLRLVPLGGLGEVGKNMMAVEYGDDILVIDTGIMFPENDMLGIDYIIPDFGYLKDKAQRVRGIVVTHGHEDHTGAIRHVLEAIPAPVYATPLTRGLLEAKLSRGGALQKASLNTIQAGEEKRLGPFLVEFFHVCHSIPDGVGLGITTPAGLLVHSGDFKFDHTPVDGWPTDFGKLAEFGERGVLALLADSTNAERPGWTPSEAVINAAFDDVFRSARGRILIGTFASLISRIQQAARAAADHNRVLALVGTSMVDNVRIARQLGYLSTPDDLIVPLDQALKMKPERVALMCTGTQGEPSSILGRLSTGTNRQFDLISGDTVVLSSHPIPGNEEMVHRTINRLLQRGARVVSDAIAPVHVSGHASQEEQKLMLQLVRPKHFVPIHGELRHLHRHAALAREIGFSEESMAVVENGTIIEFHDGKMKIGERIPGGYVFVDGSGVGDVGPAVLRERESLARDGFVIVQLRLDRKTGTLKEDARILSRGFIYKPEADSLIEAAQDRIRRTIAEAKGQDLEAQVERDLAKMFYAETKRRPFVIVLATPVG